MKMYFLKVKVNNTRNEFHQTSINSSVRKKNYSMACIYKWCHRTSWQEDNSRVWAQHSEKNKMAKESQHNVKREFKQQLPKSPSKAQPEKKLSLIATFTGSLDALMFTRRSQQQFMSQLYIANAQYYKNIYRQKMLRKPNRKITVIYQHKCLQRSKDIITLYSVHFYGYRFASLGQELEVNAALHNSKRGVRKSYWKVRKRAGKLAVSQGATWVGITTEVSKQEISCILLSYCEMIELQ